MRRVPLLAVALLLLPAVVPVPAQQSASYRMVEHAFHAGGLPWNGEIAASASFRMSLSTVGEMTVGEAAASPSFLLDPGFGPIAAPPGEVHGLRFHDAATLRWESDGSIGHYDVYREGIRQLAGGSYGACRAFALIATMTTDGDVPVLDDGFFYLVTATSRMAEEGTLGTDSSGADRAGTVPCP